MDDDIRGLQQLYFAAMLDEQKTFRTADRLLELFERGLLPIQNDEPIREWRSARARLSEAERRDAYQRVLGVPGGAVEGVPNRDFGDLWLRFVSAVGSFDRQQQPVVDAVERQIRAAIGVVSHAALAVQGMLNQSPAFRELPADTQRQIAHDTVRAAGALLSTIDFPEFVSALLNGVFHAIVDASIEQMEAYAKLVRDVAQTVDSFAKRND
jgi:hypothetical protein